MFLNYNCTKSLAVIIDAIRDPAILIYYLVHVAKLAKNPLLFWCQSHNILFLEENSNEERAQMKSLLALNNTILFIAFNIVTAVTFNIIPGIDTLNEH